MKFFKRQAILIIVFPLCVGMRSCFKNQNHKDLEILKLYLYFNLNIVSLIFLRNTVIYLSHVVCIMRTVCS